MITSIHNQFVKHLVRLREDRKYREEHQSIIVSGFKLVKELTKIVSPKRIFVEKTYHQSTSTSSGCLGITNVHFKGEVLQVSPSVLKKITGLPSPEPIAAEFPLPSSTSLTNKTSILVLDAVRDPGNLGTLVRTAAALGWEGVFFLPTCADPFHDKTIRSSRGALFRLPWQRGTWTDLEEIKEKGHLHAYIADVEGEIFSTSSRQNKILLILSNEAQGVGSRGETFGKKITIPMIGGIESLNVATAGAILMYFLKNS